MPLHDPRLESLAEMMAERQGAQSDLIAAQAVQLAAQARLDAADARIIAFLDALRDAQATDDEGPEEPGSVPAQLRRHFTAHPKESFNAEELIAAGIKARNTEHLMTTLNRMCREAQFLERVGRGRYRLAKPGGVRSLPPEI